MAVNIGVTVNELLDKMVRVCGVGRTVKVAVPTAQSTFEHLEYFFIPGSHFVAIGVFDGHALDSSDVFFIIRTKDMDPPPEQERRIIAADGTDKALAPYLTHWVKDIAGKCALGVPEHHRSSLPTKCQQTFGNNDGIIQPAFAAACRAYFDIPAMVAALEILGLLTR